jgi:hypothetical protein
MIMNRCILSIAPLGISIGLLACADSDPVAVDAAPPETIAVSFNVKKNPGGPLIKFQDCGFAGLSEHRLRIPGNVDCPPTIKKIVPKDDGGFDEMVLTLEVVEEVDESEVTSEEITAEATTSKKLKTCQIVIPNTKKVVEFPFPEDRNCPSLVGKKL